MQAAPRSSRSLGELTETEPPTTAATSSRRPRRASRGCGCSNGVPFSYLVPDAALLPLESIRFFYLDRAWTDALVQGVLSVGTVTTADRAAARGRSTRHPRRGRRGRAARSAYPAASGALRAGRDDHRLPAAVAARVRLARAARARLPLDRRAPTTPDHSPSRDPRRLKVLRMERLAPAVLLVLFDGVPAVVHVEEPRQGIQFGVRPPGGRAARDGAVTAAARPQHRRADLPATQSNGPCRSAPARRASSTCASSATASPRRRDAPATPGVRRAERVRAADAALPVPAGVRRPGERARRADPRRVPADRRVHCRHGPRYGNLEQRFQR